MFNKLVLVVANAHAPASSNTLQPSSNNLGPFGGRENVTGVAIEPLREDMAPCGVPGLSMRENKPPRSDKWVHECFYRIIPCSAPRAVTSCPALNRAKGERFIPPRVPSTSPSPIPFPHALRALH